MNNLAATYQVIGRTPEAIALFGRAIRATAKSSGGRSPAYARHDEQPRPGVSRHRQDRSAIRLYKDVLALRQRKLGPDHPDTLSSMNNLADAYRIAKRWADAETLLRECLELRQKSKRDQWLCFHTMSQLGAALAAQGKHAEAEGYLIGGYEGLSANEAKIPATRKKDVANDGARIVPFYEAWGKPKDAAIWREKLAAANPEAQAQAEPEPEP